MVAPQFIGPANSNLTDAAVSFNPRYKNIQNNINMQSFGLVSISKFKNNSIIFNKD